MVIPKDPLECFANKEGLYYLELTWQYPALGEFRWDPLTPGV